MEDSTNSQSQENGNDSPGATEATAKKYVQISKQDKARLRQIMKEVSYMSYASFCYGFCDFTYSTYRVLVKYKLN